MPKVMITLTEEERDALVRFAIEERRDPRAQAALIIKRELQRIKFLHNAQLSAQSRCSKKGG